MNDTGTGIGLVSGDPQLIALIFDLLKNQSDLRVVSLYQELPLTPTAADLLILDASGTHEVDDFENLRSDVPLIVIGGEMNNDEPAGRIDRNGLDASLIPAIRAVLAGLVVRSASGLAGNTERSSGPAPLLSARERRILRLTAGGLPSKAIASELGISERTVKFHLASIYRKLGVGSRTEAALEGARRGLIPL